MTLLKTGTLAAALLGAAAAGAGVAPIAYGQSVRVIDAPRVQIYTGGSRIGVSVADLEAVDAKATGGVRVESVEDDSPAARAGLQTGDIIVEFDGERVRSVRQFSRLVSETPAGRQVTAAVTRDGKRTALTITPRDASSFGFDGDTWRALDEAREMARIAPRPPRAPRPPAARPRPFDFEAFEWVTGNQLGVTVNTLSDQLKEYFGVQDGVLVTSVSDNSTAAKTGLKAGDVITSVNGSRIESASELREELRDVDPGEEFTLEVMRDRKPMTLKGKAEEPRSRRSTTRVIL